MLNKIKEEFYEEFSKFHKKMDKPNYTYVDKYIHFAKTLDKIENKPIYLLDLYKQNFLFVSDRYKYLLGYNDDDKEKLNFDFFLESLHPDDFEINIDAPVKFQSFISELKEEEKYNYKLISNFRLKIPSGEYIRCIEQLTNLEVDKVGNPWLVLSVTELSSNQDIKNSSGAKIFNVVTGETIKDFGKSTTVLPGLKLSKRELEVLKLISKGFLSKQISDKLKISINTVNNHRRNILDKTGCSNTFEAIKFIADFGV